MKCPEDPTRLLGYPIGMYHCPDCGCMQVAGLEHICEEGCLLEDEEGGCVDCEKRKRQEKREAEEEQTNADN
jgi:hypothetical protein